MQEYLEYKNLYIQSKGGSPENVVIVQFRTQDAPRIDPNSNGSSVINRTVLSNDVRAWSKLEPHIGPDHEMKPGYLVAYIELQLQGLDEQGTTIENILKRCLSTIKSQQKSFWEMRKINRAYDLTFVFNNEKVSLLLFYLNSSYFRDKMTEYFKRNNRLNETYDTLIAELSSIHEDTLSSQSEIQGGRLFYIGCLHSNNEKAFLLKLKIIREATGSLTGTVDPDDLCRWSNHLGIHKMDKRVLEAMLRSQEPTTCQREDRLKAEKEWHEANRL